MVDSIGAKMIAGDPRVAAVARARPVAPPNTGVNTGPSGSSGPSSEALAQTLSKAMASTAPVDAGRVAQIKTALANGTFPILPATIADQLIALRYDWLSNDQA